MKMKYRIKEAMQFLFFAFYPRTTLVVEMSNNYRHNKLAWYELQDYYSAVMKYESYKPEADDVQQKVPYILLKFLTGTDDKKAGEPEEDSCKVRIIFAVYSEDGQDGPLALLNLILRVRS